MSDMSGMPESGDTQDTQAGDSCSVDSCSVEESKKEELKKVKDDSDCCKPDDACKTEGTPCETGA